MTKNSIIFGGRVGKTPVLRHLPSGTPTLTFSVAQNERWKDKSGIEQTRTLWMDIDVMGPLAESLSQRLQSGVEVLVDGKIQTREWTDKAGMKKSKTSIHAFAVDVFGARPQPTEVATPDAAPF